MNNLQVYTCITEPCPKSDIINYWTISFSEINSTIHTRSIVIYPLLSVPRRINSPLSVTSTQKHTIILYYYSIFSIAPGVASWGGGLHYVHCTAAQLRGHVFHSHVPYTSHTFPHTFFTTFHFDTNFEQPQQNQAIYHFPNHQKSPLTTQNLIKPL